MVRKSKRKRVEGGNQIWWAVTMMDSSSQKTKTEKRLKKAFIQSQVNISSPRSPFALCRIGVLASFEVLARDEISPFFVNRRVSCDPIQKVRLISLARKVRIINPDHLIGFLIEIKGNNTFLLSSRLIVKPHIMKSSFSRSNLRGASNSSMF